VTARRTALVAGCLLAIFALMGAAMPVAMAQDATPVAEEAAPEATPVAAVPIARPVHIHSGDCVALGDVVVPLTDLTAPVGEGAGQADEATQAESSFTVVPMTLDAMLASDHAINVHLSAESIDTYIACGEIGGVVDINGALIVGLREQNNAGYTGIAFLQPNIDGVSTDVSVFIAPVFGAAG
jgi:hypothetical protein